MGRILQETMVCTWKFRDADGKDILLNNSVHAIMEIELKCSVDKIKNRKVPGPVGTVLMLNC